MLMMRTCTCLRCRSAPVSSYTMHYPDRCVGLVLAGEATLTCATDGSKGSKGKAKGVPLKAGSLVIIPEGNSCSWDIESPLMMHYNYGH